MMRLNRRFIRVAKRRLTTKIDFADTGEAVFPIDKNSVDPRERSLCFDLGAGSSRIPRQTALASVSIMGPAVMQTATVPSAEANLDYSTLAFPNFIPS
jgi:hypothetical protein